MRVSLKIRRLNVSDLLSVQIPRLCWWCHAYVEVNCVCDARRWSQGWTEALLQTGCLSWCCLNHSVRLNSTCMTASGAQKFTAVNNGLNATVNSLPQVKLEIAGLLYTTKSMWYLIPLYQMLFLINPWKQSQIEKICSNDEAQRGSRQILLFGNGLFSKIVMTRKS